MVDLCAHSFWVHPKSETTKAPFGALWCVSVPRRRPLWIALSVDPAPNQLMSYSEWSWGPPTAIISTVAGDFALAAASTAPMSVEFHGNCFPAADREVNFDAETFWHLLSLLRIAFYGNHVLVWPPLAAISLH